MAIITYMSVSDALRDELPDLTEKLEPVVRKWVQETPVLDVQAALFDFSASQQSEVKQAA